MRHEILKSAAIVIAMVAGISAPFPAAMAAEDKAQSVPKLKPPPNVRARAKNFSDARLKAFGIASTKILEIRQKYWPQVQAAGSEDEMRKIADTAQNEMMQAIKAHGLTFEQYNEIVAAAKDNRSLIERIEKIEKRSEKN